MRENTGRYRADLYWEPGKTNTRKGLGPAMGRGEAVSYFLRSHIFKVLAHHDAPELGFNETLSSFPLSWPRKKTYRKLQNSEKAISDGRQSLTGLTSAE